MATDPRYWTRNSGPMRLGRVMTLWDCEGEHERLSPHSVAVWERLEFKVEVPETAVPYFCMLNTIEFYSDRTFQEQLARVEYYDLAAAPSPHLLRIDNRWWERSSAQAVWRDGRWWIRHIACDNTRAAEWANRGPPE